MNGQRPLRVVVLSCGELGVEVADRLRTLPGAAQVALVSTPYRTRPMKLRAKLRHIYRMQGVAGFASALGARAARLVRPPRPAPPPRAPHPDVRHLRFADFHEAACVQALRALAPDLGVIAGTYILKEEVFSIPRLGCVNLHSGKVPEYRGAAPGFWELYNGETHVGTTIHSVVRDVDAGSVLRQELFPLDRAPAGDPLVYLDRLRSEVLMPNGVRMLVDTVAEIAAGTAVGRPQDGGSARTYRSPDRHAVRELRRRVRERRAEPAR